MGLASHIYQHQLQHQLHWDLDFLYYDKVLGPACTYHRTVDYRNGMVGCDSDLTPDRQMFAMEVISADVKVVG